MQLSSKRQAIRLHSNRTFDHGLVIIDVQHMLAAMGLWPALWSNGREEQGSPNTWAVKGEIDIMEQINDATGAHTALHTNSPDTEPECTFRGVSCGSSGSNQQCTCGVNKNQLCAFSGCGASLGEGSSGKPFNHNQGGVFAMQLSPGDNQITIWFWQRGDENMPLDWKSDTSSWNSQHKVRYLIGLKFYTREMKI
jgi:hypothetical protein